MRHDQYLKSTLYVGFGIGTLVVLFPWTLRRYGVELLAFDLGWARWSGAGVIALGAVVYFSCTWDFNARGQGTPAFWDPPRRLMLNPWFRVVRNPMYVGVFLMNLGQGIVFGSVAIIVYAFAVTAGFHLFVVGYEEPHLARVYGARYEAYRRRVPRWVPRLDTADE